MRTRIENKIFDEERALYNLTSGDVINCRFEGPADGESVLKEARDITVKDSFFALRYPLWHVKGFAAVNITLGETSRAAIWYASDGEIKNSTLSGIKAVRECENIKIAGCEIVSPEFGWKSSGVSLKDTKITSEYLFLDSRDISLKNVEMRGKYSFQYVDGLTVDDSVLDTKDAFWHSKNVTVRDSVVKGEYLGWFSEGLTLINCKISGTQPLCYCKDLRLVNCAMDGADFSFEYSDVEADVIGHIISVKNPRSGTIVADSIGEIISEDAVMECAGKCVIRSANDQT